MKTLTTLLCSLLLATLSFSQAPVITKNIGMPVGNASITGLTYGNDIYVCVFATGKMYNSLNGTSWTKVSDPSFPNIQFSRVTFGNGKFIAVARFGKILSSVDGATWTHETSGTTRDLYDVQFFENKFYTTGGSGTLLSSSDGIVWSPVIINGVGNYELPSISFGNGQFVIAARDGGYARIFTSSTGLSNSWSTQVLGFTMINKVLYIKDRFYSLTSNAFIYTSSDGITWTFSSPTMTVTLPDATIQTAGSPNHFTNGFHDGNKFYFFGSSRYQDGYGTIFSSTDGWNFVLESKMTYIVCQGSAFLNGRYFQYGNEGIISSSNGLDYTYPEGNFTSVASNGSGYVGVGPVSRSGVIFKSSDFNTWESKTPSNLRELNAVEWTGTKYIAAGFQQVLSSPDGETWSQIATSDDVFLTLTSGADKLVAASYDPVTYEGKLSYSVDGSSWTTANTTDNYYFKTKYVNGNYFALGHSNATYLGVIMHSTNGITWNNITPNFPFEVYYFNDVVYDGSRYYFMGMEFKDAATWDLDDFFSVNTATIYNPNSFIDKGGITSPPAGALIGGTYGEGAFEYHNGHFVGSAIDINTNRLYVLHSENGHSWTAVDMEEETPIYDIVASNNVFRMIGYGNSKVTVSYAGALPVQLLNFTAQKSEEQSLLKWQTQSEHNSRDFIIQHSVNGTTWTSVGAVSAAGSSNSLKAYSYLHTDPVQGINYYRLLQRDIDQRTTTSNVANVVFNNVMEMISVFPNPVENHLLQIKTSKAGTVNLFNSTGSLMLRKVITAGKNKIDVAGISAGTYILEFSGKKMKVFIK